MGLFHDEGSDPQRAHSSSPQRRDAYAADALPRSHGKAAPVAVRVPGLGLPGGGVVQSRPAFGGAATRGLSLKESSWDDFAAVDGAAGGDTGGSAAPGRGAARGEVGGGGAGAVRSDPPAAVPTPAQPAQDATARALQAAAALKAASDAVRVAEAETAAAVTSAEEKAMQAEVGLNRAQAEALASAQELDAALSAATRALVAAEAAAAAEAEQGSVGQGESQETAALKAARAAEAEAAAQVEALNAQADAAQSAGDIIAAAAAEASQAQPPPADTPVQARLREANAHVAQLEEALKRAVAEQRAAAAAADEEKRRIGGGRVDPELQAEADAAYAAAATLRAAAVEAGQQLKAAVEARHAAEAAAQNSSTAAATAAAALKQAQEQRAAALRAASAGEAAASARVQAARSAVADAQAAVVDAASAGAQRVKSAKDAVAAAVATAQEAQAAAAAALAAAAAPPPKAPSAPTAEDLAREQAARQVAAKRREAAEATARAAGWVPRVKAATANGGGQRVGPGSPKAGAVPAPPAVVFPPRPVAAPAPPPPAPVVAPHAPSPSPPPPPPDLPQASPAELAMFRQALAQRPAAQLVGEDAQVSRAVAAAVANAVARVQAAAAARQGGSGSPRAMSPATEWSRRDDIGNEDEEEADTLEFESPTARGGQRSGPSLSPSSPGNSPARALASRLAGGDSAWAVFSASPPASIRVDDVPWPDFGVLRRVMENDIERALEGDTSLPPHGSIDFQGLVERWHPQRFRTRFAACLAGADGARIMRRVTEVAGLLDGEWRQHSERLRRIREGGLDDEDDG